MSRLLHVADGPGGLVEQAPPVPLREIVRRFWPFARPYRRWIALLLALVAVSAAIDTVGSVSRLGLGTRQYAPPEQALGGELTAAADVWGVGAVLLEALTRRRPFDVPAGDEGPFPAATERPPSVATLRRVPGELARVVDACLDPSPAARPSVAELADTLDGLIGPDP